MIDSHQFVAGCDRHITVVPGYSTSVLGKWPTILDLLFLFILILIVLIGHFFIALHFNQRTVTVYMSLHLL